ncbi:MAG: hypothetical protein KatS3mg060_1137 [Dehalococcoidia bacterium]|nr:MAG: hypothetical protein KatS3mg060_1137 [Dehalococcoidia bacterium]
MNETTARLIRAAESLGARRWAPNGDAGPIRYYLPGKMVVECAREAGLPTGNRVDVYVDGVTGAVRVTSREHVGSGRVRSAIERVGEIARRRLETAEPTPEPPADSTPETTADSTPETTAASASAPASGQAPIVAEFLAQFAARFGGAPTPEQAAKLLRAFEAARRAGRPVELGRPLAADEAAAVEEYLQSIAASATAPAAPPDPLGRRWERVEARWRP